MSHVTRPGIPTTYRGVRFRSRLEAKWACFFDLMGWRWEYEPFDADGYIPDFVLLGDDPVLVEVKPAISLSDLVGPVEHARRRVGDTWTRDILGLGLTPFIQDGTYWHGSCVLGLLDEAALDEEGIWHEMGEAIWNECGHCGLVSFRHDAGWFKSRICGHHDGDHYVNDPTDMLELEIRWACATNASQWRP